MRISGGYTGIGYQAAEIGMHGTPPLEVWSIRPAAAPALSLPLLQSISSFRGPSSLRHRPPAVTSVVGQLQPLVQGRAGLPRLPPPPPPPLGGGGTYEGADDDHPKLTPLQQRRLSHASASTSTGAAPALDHAATARDDSAGPAEFRANSWLHLWGPRLQQRQITTAQAAVRLLRIADEYLKLVGNHPRLPEAGSRAASSATKKPRRSAASSQQQQKEQQQSEEPDMQPETQSPPLLRPPLSVLTGLDQLALWESVEVLQPLLPLLSVGQLQRCLETLASVGHTPPDPWVHDFLAASEPLLPRADATETYGMLAAMKALRIRPQRLQWTDGAAGALSRHLAQLAAPQVVELLCCFADLALQPPEGLLSRIFALLLPDVPQLQPRLVLDLLAGCSRMRCMPPLHLLEAAYEALTPAVLAAAPPHPLCRLAAAMAALRLQPPPDLLTALVTRADGLLRLAVQEAGGGGDSATLGGGGADGLGAPTAAEGATQGQQAAGGRVLRPRRSARRSAANYVTAATVTVPELDVGAVVAAAVGAEAPLLTLTPTQLSCLLRDLRTLAAALPPAWSGLCGRYIVTCVDASTPIVDVSYLLGALSRCGLKLEPSVVRVVAARLEASLQEARDQRRQRRREDDAAGAGPEVGSGESAVDVSEESAGESSGEGGTRPIHGRRDADGEVEVAAGPLSQRHASARSQWSPKALSTAATALVPYAALLPPSLLRALYGNLYDTLERFDLPHLTATLHALPYLASPQHLHRRADDALAAPPPPPLPLLASYLSCLHGRMHRMQPWQLSMCLFALLRLRVRPDPPWMDAFLGQVYHTLPHMNEVQISSVAWVVAKLSYRPQEEWVERLLAAAAGRLSCFSPRHLCQLLWAVAAMGYQPGDAWMARWLDKARGHFRTSDGRTLASLTWALATLGHVPGEPWLQDLCQHLARRLPYTQPRAVANTLAALAALGHRPSDDCLDAVTAHVRGRLAAPSGQGSAAAAAAGGSYNLQDLAHACHSLVRLGHRPTDEWLGAVAAAAARLALNGPPSAPTLYEEDFGDDGDESDDDASDLAAATAAAAHAKHIALLALALARLQRRPPPSAWAALLDGLHPCLPYAPPQSLAVLLAAAAALRLPLPREHSGALLLATHRRMGSCSGGGLAMVLRAFVELGLHPGSRWLGRLEEVLLLRRVQAEHFEQQQQRRRGSFLRSSGSEVAELDTAGLGAEVESDDGSNSNEVREGSSGEAAAGPPPPLLLPSALALGSRERCSMLWAVATLETSRLVETKTSSRDQQHQQHPSQPSLDQDSYPPPARWARKPGPLRRPLQHGGLMSLLLPAAEPPWSAEASQEGERSRWRQLTACSGQDLSLVCWSLGRLRARPRGLMRALLAEVQARLVSGLEPPSPISPGTTATTAAAEAPVKARARGFGPRSLAMAFWGISSVGVWPSPQWQAAAAAAALQMAREGMLGPQDLATVLAALARWRRAPRERQQRRRLQLIGRERERARYRRRGGEAAGGSGPRRAAAAARARACTAALAALALADSAARMQQPLQPPPPPPGLDAGGAPVLADPGHYDARSLATLAWALASLGVRQLPDPWVAAFMPASLRLLAQLPPSHRVTMLDSLSRLGLRPGLVWLDRAEQVALDGGIALASSHRGLDLAMRRMAA